MSGSLNDFPSVNRARRVVNRDMILRVQRTRNYVEEKKNCCFTAVYVPLRGKGDNAVLRGYAQTITLNICVRIYKARRALSKVRRVYLTR